MNSNTQLDSKSLKDLWEVFVDNIWIYVISIVVALAVAVAYITVTPPKYERMASIMIKDTEQGQSIGSQSGSFDNLALFQSNVDIINEINIIKSKSFMTDVVERLKLDHIYKRKDIRWVDLYKNTPFVVDADSLLMSKNFTFKVDFDTNGEFAISDFEIYNNGHDLDVDDMKGALNSDLVTPYGTLRLLPTPLFDAGAVAHSSYSFSKSPVKSLVEFYLGSLNVALRSSDASIVDLRMSDECAERAENILNTLISVYNENWIKDKNEITFNTSSFIDGRLAVIEHELESVDGSIAQFKSDKLMPDVSSVAGIQLQQTTENTNEQLLVKNQLSMAQYIQSYLRDVMVNDQLLPANTGIDNPNLESLIGRYNDLLLQKNLLMANSSENNPLIADMITNLKSLREVINTSIKDLISTLDIRLKNLQGVEAQNKANLSSTPRQAKELLGVERQQMVKEQLFLYLLQKREENELSQAFSAYNTKVLSAADGSQHPKEPKKSMILLFAMAVGCILPTLYVIIKESFDTSVKGKKDIEMLNVPYIGTIPYIAPAQGADKNLVSAIVGDGSRDIASESFKVARTNLDFMLESAEERAQVIQLISLMPGSGKSFISVNLALSMALKDSKVLVIDCDIRRKTLSRSLDAISKAGICEYLCGKVSNIDELIIKQHLNDNLDMLPSGVIPPNPSELLLKPRFKELIAAMKEHYDYIFIDCPPVEIVPDSAIIGRFCDASIFVIRAESFDKRLLPEVEAICESQKYKRMSILLNGVKSRGRGYSGYSRYGYTNYGYASAK